jgi:hypothetical protein
MHIDTEIEEVEEDHMETSEDKSTDDETYKMSLMPTSENSAEEDDEGDGSEEGQEDEVENVKEEGVIEGTLNPLSGQRDHFDPSPTICILHKSLRYVVANYKGKGATKKVKRCERLTHMKIYETVIMDRKKIISEAQWVDWRHMEAQQDPIYDQVIAACERHHLKILMDIHYDWNVEVIAQFYATLYIEEGSGARRMHWMTEGDWFHISYDDFTSCFSFGAVDARRQRPHLQNPLDENEMKFMYAPRLEGNAGTIIELYTFYSILNRLFRKTVCPRDGDPTNISQSPRTC